MVAVVLIVGVMVVPTLVAHLVLQIVRAVVATVAQVHAVRDVVEVAAKVVRATVVADAPPLVAVDANKQQQEYVILVQRLACRLVAMDARILVRGIVTLLVIMLAGRGATQLAQQMLKDQTVAFPVTVHVVPLVEHLVLSIALEVVITLAKEQQVKHQKTLNMKSIRLIFYSLLAFAFIACEKGQKGQLPIVVTGQAEVFNDIHTVTCEGYVEADGGNAVVDRGICYVAGAGTPTVADSRVSAGSGKGAFTAILEGLKDGKYSYRAFATNSAGTAYGEVATFSMGNDDEPADGEYITIARAKEIASALADNTPTEKTYKVKGVLSDVMTAADKVPNTYTNLHLRIKDETGEMGCYYTNYLNNKPFTSANQIPAIGTDVIIEGPLYKYVSGSSFSLEFIHAWFVSIGTNK